MANNYSVLIPKIFSMIQPVLRTQLELVKNLNPDFDGAAAKLGDVVTVPLPISSSGVQAITPGQYAPAPTDVVAQNASITISNWYGSVPFAVTTKEGGEIFDKPQFVERAIQSAVQAIAGNMNQSAFATYKKVYGFAGTAGTDPFATNTKPVMDVAGVLDAQLCPVDDRMLILGNLEKTSATKTDDLRVYFNAGASQTLRTGVIGSLEGMDVAWDVDRPIHTAGTCTGLLVDNGGGYPAGTTTVTTDVGSGTVLAGDIITFAGDLKRNGITSTYVVVSSVGGSSPTSVTFTPGLSGPVADDAAITLKASHSVNLAFRRNGAIGLVARLPKADVEGQTLGNHFVYVDPLSKLPLLLSHFPALHEEIWQISALWGVDMVRPELAARLAGAI